jgi:cytochrome c biogenesis protein CcdA
MLKLPEPLRKRINATIRKGRHARNYVIGAFTAGIIISFLELACTGQVYLPTIIFVSSIPELRLRALLYLILYNLLFILPLVIIFILVYFGTTSKQLTGFFQKNAAAVKFAMGAIFLILGGWLVFSLVF